MDLDTFVNKSVNIACLCKKINCWRLQMTAALKLRSRQLCRCSGIKSWQNTPKLPTTALKSLLPFPTTYLCETGFSAVTATKSKQRNKLDISNTLRVSLSRLPQMGPSHLQRNKLRVQN
ncbi:hypothetical protein TNCV_3741901 [Trichonephila clavipes]|nr:hypothetical protein TNCV_3741901 [Trichonephila clavipes]